MGITGALEDEVDIQIKEVTGALGAPCADGDNIVAGGFISMVAKGPDSEVQIEENNRLVASGDITLTSDGGTGQTEIKSGTTLDSTGGDVDLNGADCIIEDGVAPDLTATVINGFVAGAVGGGPGTLGGCASVATD